MSNILVTGGAGFIGSALCNRLAKEGHRVTALDDFSRGNGGRMRYGIGQVHADIRDAEAVDRAVAEADVIFHLAYMQGTQTFYSDPRAVIDVALTGIMNVLHACERHPGKELMLVSSSEAYQIPPQGMTPTDETVPLSVPDVTNPRYSYGGGKIACEIAAMAYAKSGVLKRTIILRPHNIYGPDMGFEHVIPEFCLRMNHLPTDQEEFAIQGTGFETRSFCHIDDCVQAFMTAYEHGTDQTVYHVGTMEEVTIAELATAVAEQYNRTIWIKPGRLPDGSPPRRLPDIARLQALGYEPKIDLATGLGPTVDWYKNCGR